MKFITARFCPECEEVFDSRQKIIPGQICPSCTNKHTVMLSNLIFKNKEGKRPVSENGVHKD